MGGVLAKIVFKSGHENVIAPEEHLWEIKHCDIDGNNIVIGDLINEETKCVLFVNVATD